MMENQLDMGVRINKGLVAITRRARDQRTLQMARLTSLVVRLKTKVDLNIHSDIRAKSQGPRRSDLRPHEQPGTTKRTRPECFRKCRASLKRFLGATLGRPRKILNQLIAVRKSL
jgi:hypothetical protein